MAKGATDPVKADRLFSIGVTQGRLADMTSSGVAVSTQVATSQQVRIGSSVAVTFPTTGTRTFTVQAIYSVRDLAGDYVLPLIGIANTLALSVYERTRELGLLRAVGTTRGQLRSMVRAESLVISLFGALEGLALGMLSGWAIVTAMHSQGITHLVFPVPQLLLMAALAGLAGLVAAIAPSRRAARLDILQAVTTE